MSVKELFNKAATKAGSFLWDNIRGGNLTLRDAIEKHDWQKTGRILQLNPEAADWDLEDTSPIKCKPLHAAATAGDFNTFSILLRPEFFKGDIDIRDSEGATPLIRAAWSGNELIVKALIAKGADMNAMDKHGHSAMSIAAGHNRVATMRTLLAHGAEVNGPSGGARPIVNAASHSLYLHALRFLIAAGAELNKPDNNATPLQNCWNAPNWEGLHALLDAGADPNLPDAMHGARLLSWTVRGNNAAATEKLLKCGADPTASPELQAEILLAANDPGVAVSIRKMVRTRIGEIEAQQAVTRAIKEMTAGTSAAISVKPIKLKLS